VAHGRGSWSLLGVGGWLLPWVCRAHCPWCVADHGCGSQSQLAVAALGVRLSNSCCSSCGPGWAAVCSHGPGWAADPDPWQWVACHRPFAVTAWGGRLMAPAVAALDFLRNFEEQNLAHLHEPNFHSRIQIPCFVYFFNYVHRRDYRALCTEYLGLVF
jgi:hypothetical protein